MFKGKSKENLKLASTNVFLIANAFVWYLLAFNFIKANATPAESLFIIGINTGAIALSGLIGTLLADKVKKHRLFLYCWLAAGIILSIVPIGLNPADSAQLTIISLIFGAYFGFGMPATMGYHSSFANIEGRAKLGGITFLIIGLMFAISGFISLGSLLFTCIILAFLRLSGLAVFHLNTIQKTYEESKPQKFSNVITNKSFILYFIPWLMFTLINFMTFPSQVNLYPNLNIQSSLTAMENVLTAVVALISGFVADRMGRKRLSIIGFVMLGIGYAIAGLFGGADANKLVVSIVYSVSDGVAWGIFYVLFLFTIWGDLAPNSNGNKFYFLGALPYISSYFVKLVLTPYLSTDVQTIFSFASVFLFLAVLPLIYAPETLPEKHMKDRELKNYIEKAKKIAQKEEEKSQKQTNQEKEENVGTEENSEDYAKAKELAEKYY